jgi:hypothetical protein
MLLSRIASQTLSVFLSSLGSIALLNEDLKRVYDTTGYTMLLKNCNLECLKIENKHCQTLELFSIDSLKGNIESK